MASVISLKEAVVSIINNALPNLDENKLNAVVELIMDQEPSQCEDLLYFEEKDFNEVITKLQARKLIACINAYLQGNNESIISKSECVRLSSVPGTSESNTSGTQISDALPGPEENTSITNPNWAKDFEIPFKKFPSAVQQQCIEGLRPNPEERKHIIRILAYEISKITKKPGKKNLEIIASNLVQKYPLSFQDKIAGKAFGNGYSSFLHSLVLKFDNLNRIKKESLKSKLLTPSTTREKRIKKRCPNFQPDNFPEEETEATQMLKKKWLQEQFNRKEQFDDDIRDAMNATFASQRLTINTTLYVHEVVREWPYLSKKDFILNHFNMAMKPFYPDWDCILHKKMPELFSFLKSILKDESDYCVMTTIKLLCAYFNESNQHIYLYKDYDSLEDVDMETSPVTPFIAVFGSNSAAVCIERKSFGDYENIEDSFKIWFSAYYVFNLQYPDDCLATMDFIQRGLMGIHEDAIVNKSAHKKATKLVKSLCNFKNLWSTV